MPTRSLEDRFWSKVKKTDGCWEWQASKDKNGYGCFRAGNRIEYAHRVAWSLANGIELLWEGYDAIPTGIFAATMMRQSLARAEQAAASGDVVAMLAAYEDLKGYDA